MIRFDAAHAAVHFPKDRCFCIWVRPSILTGIFLAILSLIVTAWIELALVGLPYLPPVPQVYPNDFAGFCITEEGDRTSHLQWLVPQCARSPLRSHGSDGWNRSADSGYEGLNGG